MDKRIPVAGPWITQREIDYVADAVKHAWYADAGMYHDRFEGAFASRVGRAHAMALPSCTSAIHLALAAMSIGPGDEVIIPETTWIATAAPVSYVAATPVFVDVDPVTWCISPQSFEAAITPRTKAVITVDLYGNMADYDEILQIAAKHGLRVIEDCAEAAGATYKGKEAGGFGGVSVFSFHGSKTLTTGEGGMLLTDDPSLFERANFLRDHGRSLGDISFENTEIAFKYKMSSMQAALGLAQLERLDDLLRRKREAFSWYAAGLEGIPGIQINDPGPDVVSSYWMASIVWDASCGLTKRQVHDHLAAVQIDSRPFFSPLSSLQAYCHQAGMSGCRERNPVSYSLRDQGINLPSSLIITEEEVGRVCGRVKELFR